MDGEADCAGCGNTDCKVDSRIASCVKSPLVTLQHRGIIQPSPSRPAEPISPYRGGGLKAPCGLTSSMPSMADYSVELCRDFEIEESEFSKGQIQLIHTVCFLFLSLSLSLLSLLPVCFFFFLLLSKDWTAEFTHALSRAVTIVALYLLDLFEIVCWL